MKWHVDAPKTGVRVINRGGKLLINHNCVFPFGRCFFVCFSLWLGRWITCRVKKYAFCFRFCWHDQSVGQG